MNTDESSFVFAIGSAITSIGGGLLCGSSVGVCGGIGFGIGVLGICILFASQQYWKIKD